MFPKQFKTQQYYDILKHICPELEKAQPGALKSKRWVYPRFGDISVSYFLPKVELMSSWTVFQPLVTIPSISQAPRSDHSHLSGCRFAGDPASG